MELTVDELAQRAGLTTTTIRLYQGKGLLSGPEIRGRVGVYGPGHLARLRLIGSLQERGFSLAAIRALVDSWDGGATLSDVMGAEEPLILDAAGFAAQFPSGQVDATIARRAVELGIVELHGTEIVVRRPRFLRVGRELVEMGVPVEEVLEEYAHLKEAADEIATRFAELFERRFWRPAQEAGVDETRAVELTATLARLRSLASAVVETAVSDALERAATERLSRLAGDER